MWPARFQFLRMHLKRISLGRFVFKDKKICFGWLLGRQRSWASKSCAIFELGFSLTFPTTYEQKDLGLYHPVKCGDYSKSQGSVLIKQYNHGMILLDLFKVMFTLYHGKPPFNLNFGFLCCLFSRHVKQIQIFMQRYPAYMARGLGVGEVSQLFKEKIFTHRNLEKWLRIWQIICVKWGGKTKTPTNPYHPIRMKSMVAWD